MRPFTSVAVTTCQFVMHTPQAIRVQSVKGMMDGKKRHAWTETSPSAALSITSTTVSGLNLGICDDQPKAGHTNYDIRVNYNVV